MAVTTDIARTWRGPRKVMAELLAQGKREDRAVAFAFAACIIFFAAQWPRYTRWVAGFDTPEGFAEFALSDWLVYGAFSWLIIGPLMLYAVAALLHLLARLLGGKGTFYSARMAFFWSLLASAPLILLHGLTAGFIGEGVQTQVVGFVWFAVFLWFLIQTLREAEA